MTNVDTRSAPEWKSWATLDEDGFLCTLGEISERRADVYRTRRETERHIAEKLGEKEPWPQRLIHVIVKHIGTEQALAFLHDAWRLSRRVE